MRRRLFCETALGPYQILAARSFTAVPWAASEGQPAAHAFQDLL